MAKLVKLCGNSFWGDCCAQPFITFRMMDLGVPLVENISLSNKSLYSWTPFQYFTSLMSVLQLDNSEFPLGHVHHTDLDGAR